MSTVFVGGGTPTLLAADDLVRLLRRIETTFGLAGDAEVTTEANPESVSPASLSALREGGFTRISFGMQSAVPHVLATLDRVHSPGRPLTAVAEARAAGFEQVSLDLIYGTPGESLADWRTSLEVALSARPDHVSAYALVVEDGTKMATRVRRGELPLPDDDDLADKYLLADELLSGAGYDAYEVSNWSVRPGRCLPAQSGLLARGRLVGSRSRRPQPRRGHALVERQAPGRVRRPPGLRPVTGTGARSALGGRSGAGAGAAGDPVGGGDAVGSPVGPRPGSGGRLGGQVVGDGDR